LWSKFLPEALLPACSTHVPTMSPVAHPTSAPATFPPAKKFKKKDFTNIKKSFLLASMEKFEMATLLFFASFSNPVKKPKARKQNKKEKLLRQSQN